MQHKQFQVKAILLAVFSIYTMPQMAFAENKADALETGTIEVISVTPLSSLGVPINQVPSNVQVAKGTDIQDQHGLSIADYLANNLMGVNVNQSQNNPYQPDVNFRGFTASPLLGTPQGLSVYQDGVRINMPFGDTVNWDLIPQNAIANIALMPGSNPLFGLNTLGGALSITTKSGEHFPGGRVQAYGGSFGRQAVEAEYGGKLDNGVSYFFAANKFKEDGWRANSATDVQQGFGKLGWSNEKTDVDVSFTLADNDMNGNGFTPESMLQGLGYKSIYTQPDNTKNKMGFVNAKVSHWLSDELMATTNVYYRNTRTSTYNGDVNDDYEDGPADPAEADETYQGKINRGNIKQNSYGVTGQLSWVTDKNLLVGGFGYDKADIRYTQTSQLFSTFSASRGVDGDLDVINPEVNLSGKTDTWSIFATDTYSPTSKLALTASARYNRTNVNNLDHLIPVGGAGTGSLTGAQTFQRLNPAIGFTYTPVTSLNFFGGYNEGSRAPSSIEIACADPLVPCRLPNSMAGDPPLNQVVAKTWEGGVRGNLSDSVKWSLGAYTTNSSNDLMFISSPISPSLGYFSNVGATRRSGFDMGFNGKMGAFSWSTSYSFVKATFESNFNVVNEVNALADADGVFQVSAGNRMAGIPEHQLKLRGEYKVVPNWVVGANVQMFSNQYIRGNDNNADPDGVIGGYAVLNMDTRYTVNNTGWQVFAKVNNVLNRQYYNGGMLGESMFSAAGAFGDESKARFLAPGAPRGAWVGLSYDFGRPKTSAVADKD